MYFIVSYVHNFAMWVGFSFLIVFSTEILMWEVNLFGMLFTQMKLFDLQDSSFLSIVWKKGTWLS